MMFFGVFAKILLSHHSIRGKVILFGVALTLVVFLLPKILFTKPDDYSVKRDYSFKYMRKFIENRSYENLWPLTKKM